MSKGLAFGVVVISVFLAIESQAQVESALAPKPAKTIVLEGVGAPRKDVGVPGRIDHFAYDPATGRLFVAALENGSLEVLDLEKGERVKSITGLAHPQGIAVVTSIGCVAVACGTDGVMHVYDTRSLEEKAAVNVGRGADNVRYDARADTVYVAYGNSEGGALAVFNARNWERVRDIQFQYRPESFQLDPTGGRVFANLPGGLRAKQDGVVAVADCDSGQVIAEIPLKGLARNFPMAFDAAHERLFVATRKPARLVEIDTRKYAVIAAVECWEDSDDLFYDAKTDRVAVIGGGYRPDFEDPSSTRPAGAEETGAIDVFSVGPAGEMKRLASASTVPHARTGFLVGDRREVYVAVPPRGTADAEIRAYKLPD